MSFKQWPIESIILGGTVIGGQKVCSVAITHRLATIMTVGPCQMGLILSVLQFVDQHSQRPTSNKVGHAYADSEDRALNIQARC